MKERYVVFVTWGNPPDDIEELDLFVEDKRQARLLAAQILRDDYEPGWRIVKVEGPKIGLYL